MHFTIYTVSNVENKRHNSKDSTRLKKKKKKLDGYLFYRQVIVWKIKIKVDKRVKMVFVWASCRLVGVLQFMFGGFSPTFFPSNLSTYFWNTSWYSVKSIVPLYLWNVPHATSPKHNWFSSVLTSLRSALFIKCCALFFPSIYLLNAVRKFSFNFLGACSRNVSDFLRHTFTHFDT